MSKQLISWSVLLMYGSLNGGSKLYLVPVTAPQGARSARYRHCATRRIIGHRPWMGHPAARRPQSARTRTAPCPAAAPVSYTHLRAHETLMNL
eukprot:2906367-Prymnesium_polylepis.1